MQHVHDDRRDRGARRREVGRKSRHDGRSSHHDCHDARCTAGVAGDGGGPSSHREPGTRGQSSSKRQDLVAAQHGCDPKSGRAAHWPIADVLYDSKEKQGVDQALHRFCHAVVGQRLPDRSSLGGEMRGLGQLDGPATAAACSAAAARSKCSTSAAANSGIGSVQTRVSKWRGGQAARGAERGVVLHADGTLTAAWVSGRARSAGLRG